MGPLLFSLHLSIKLGEGAFGVVMKGCIIGVGGRLGQEPAEVAVKMLKGLSEHPVFLYVV